jgi:ATP-dependent DNA ligase
LSSRLPLAITPPCVCVLYPAASSCLPIKAQQPPSGPLWWHEIKHDSFRVIARKDGVKVRLYSRPGNSR